MPQSRRALLWTICLAGLAAACAPTPPRPSRAFTDIPFAAWTDDEPGYRLYPGDEIDLTVPSAPELSRPLRLGPDGRISPPLVGPVMAADRSTEALARELEAAYGRVLVRPVVEVSLRQAAPVKVFVGGAVGQPGVYEINGDVDALQAVMMAGGFTAGGRPDTVVILRRGAGGRAMLRTADLARALKDARQGERVPLRRFDVVFVPHAGGGAFGPDMAAQRDALPANFRDALARRN